MTPIISPEASATAYDEAERIDGRLFSVHVTHQPSDGQTWTVWLTGPSTRHLASGQGSEAPLCALCERPTPHGGVAAVAFSKADRSFELHELDSEGNSIYRMTEQS